MPLRTALVFPLLSFFLSGTPLRAQFSTSDLASSDTQMIGQPAPAWAPRGWVNSEPLELGGLRGRVILLRFFNDQPMGASAVRLLHENYHSQGLSVVGFYAPAPMPTDTDPARIRNLATGLGFQFPVANDSRWETVNRYWLNRADAEPGGMTFLIDRRGIVRYIQPDGRYEKNSRDRRARGEFDKLEKLIQALLREPEESSAGD